MASDVTSANSVATENVYDYPPVAGIPVRHIVPRGWPVENAFFTPWPHTTATFAPVVVEHVVGEVDVSRLEPCAGVPAEDEYFRDDSGEITIRFATTNFPTQTRYLRAIRAGHHYRLHYSRTPDAPVYPWFRDRVVYTLSLPARGMGFIAHATAFRHPAGFGVLCPARAGTGKSTLAGMIRSFDAKIPLLSDDRVIVREHDSTFDICGTPWFSAAKAASPECATLGAVVLMDRAEVPRVRPIEPVEAVRRILQCLALPWWDDRQMDVALGQLDTVTSRVPVLECAYPVDVGSAAWLMSVLSVETDER